MERVKRAQVVIIRDVFVLIRKVESAWSALRMILLCDLILAVKLWS